MKALLVLALPDTTGRNIIKLRTLLTFGGTNRERERKREDLGTERITQTRREITEITRFDCGSREVVKWWWRGVESTWTGWERGPGTGRVRRACDHRWPWLRDDWDHDWHTHQQLTKETLEREKETTLTSLALEEHYAWGTDDQIGTAPSRDATRMCSMQNNVNLQLTITTNTLDVSHSR